MAHNKTRGFNPNDRQERLIERYMREEGLKSSHALSNIVDFWATRYYGSADVWFFREVAKAALVAAVAISFVWWQFGVGQTYTYLFFGLSGASLFVHVSNLRPFTAIVGGEEARS